MKIERPHMMALMNYIAKATNIIPVTGGEWNIIAGVVNAFSDVANGTHECEITEIKPETKDKETKTD